MAGYKNFIGGAILGESDLDDYLMRQTVMRFADASARDTALASILTEGLLAYLLDVNTLTMYDGSAWVQLLTVGAWTAYTPTSSTWVLGNATVSGAYQKIGRSVTCRGSITVGSSTTFASNLIFSIPVAAVTAVWAYGGNLSDVSSGVLSPAAFRIGSATSTSVEPFALTAVNQLNNSGLTSTVPWTWATGDIIAWLFTYEAAS